MRVTISRSTKSRLLRKPLHVVTFSPVLSELEIAIIKAKGLRDNVFSVFSTPLNRANNIPYAKGKTFSMTVGFLLPTMTGRTRVYDLHFDDPILAENCEAALRESCKTLADYLKDTDDPGDRSDTFEV